MPTRQRRLYAKNNTAEVICQLPFDTLRTKTAEVICPPLPKRMTKTKTPREELKH